MSQNKRKVMAVSAAGVGGLEIFRKKECSASSMRLFADTGAMMRRG
jgi:hypothetical protein